MRIAVVRDTTKTPGSGLFYSRSKAVIHCVLLWKSWGNSRWKPLESLDFYQGMSVLGSMLLIAEKCVFIDVSPDTLRDLK